MSKHFSTNSAVRAAREAERERVAQREAQRLHRVEFHNACKALQHKFNVRAGRTVQA